MFKATSLFTSPPFSHVRRFFLLLSLGAVGGVLFAGTGVDSGTDDDDDESPFADKADALEADVPTPEETVDEVLARLVYIERFDLHGLRWRFTFYRGPDGWSLNDVYFDDEIEAVLDA